MSQRHQRYDDENEISDEIDAWTDVSVDVSIQATTLGSLKHIPEGVNWPTGEDRSPQSCKAPDNEEYKIDAQEPLCYRGREEAIVLPCYWYFDQSSSNAVYNNSSI